MSLFSNLLGNPERPTLSGDENFVQWIAEAEMNLSTEKSNLETYQQAEQEAKQEYETAKGTGDEGWKKQEWVKCMNAVENCKKQIKVYKDQLTELQKQDRNAKNRKK